MEEIISMSYGNGGKKTSKLIDSYIIPSLGNEALNILGDGAVLPWEKNLAFSTDSFVIYPHFFPGGDIGKLSVCGTVNDLLMCGSIPRYLSLSFIIEEGFKISDLELIIKSIKQTADEAGVKIVTGDTKVVDKGHGHGIYINTSGIGEKIEGLNYGRERICKGDKVILTGSCGNHGAAILCAREGFFEGNIKSDCKPLNKVADIFFTYGNEVKILRDPTRGGIATTLNEFVENMNIGIELMEDNILIDEEVGTACNMLGLDPLYSANEGKILAVVSEKVCGKLIEDLEKCEYSKGSCCIGEVEEFSLGRVIIRNQWGGHRILDKLSYDALPRIC